MGKTLKCVRLCLLPSLPGRNEVACSGGDATEDVGVASCESVAESLSSMSMSLGTVSNKTLGRARDPRANGAWLSKLTERNMKCLS